MINKCLGYSGIQGTWNHFWWGNRANTNAVRNQDIQFHRQPLMKGRKKYAGGGVGVVDSSVYLEGAYRTRSLKHKEWNEMKWKTIGKERKTEQKVSTCHLRQINCSFVNFEKSCLRSIFKTLTFHVLISLAAWMSFVSHLVHGY